MLAEGAQATALTFIQRKAADCAPLLVLCVCLGLMQPGREGKLANQPAFGSSAEGISRSDSRTSSRNHRAGPLVAIFGSV